MYQLIVSEREKKTVGMADAQLSWALMSQVRLVAGDVNYDYLPFQLRDGSGPQIPTDFLIQLVGEEEVEEGEEGFHVVREPVEVVEDLSCSHSLLCNLLFFSFL